MKIKNRKISSFFSSHWPILFIFFVWFVFSHQYFIKGLVPYPSTYQVNHFPPWSLNDRFWGPVKNGAMPDVIDQLYPWRHLTIQTFLSGQMPYWNPYNFAGNPHLANFQSAVFSPFNILFLLLPFLDAWSMLVLLQTLVAGLGMYLFMRSLRVSEIGAVIGGVAYMFCGFIVVWMAYGTLSMAIALLPLALFAIETGFSEFRYYIGLLLSFSLASSFFSGHFQTSFYLLLYAFAYYVFKVVSEKKRREAIWILGFFIFGIFISLLQIVPSIRLYLSSIRSEAFINSGGIPLQYLVTLFAPDFYGNPVTRNDWMESYAERASFVGIIPITFTAFSLGAYKNRTALFFIIASLIALVMAVQSPLLGVLGTLKIPVLSTSTPSRIIVLTSFSLAVLAGFGFDQYRKFLKKKSIRKVFITFFVISLILGAIWAIILFSNVMSPDKAAIAKRNLFLPSFFFAGFYALSILLFFWKHRYLLPSVFCFILFALSFDSLRFALKWMPFESRELVFPDLPVISGIKKHIGYGRIFGNLGTQVETYYGFPSLEGYDPLYSQRYGEFIQASYDGKFLPAERSVVKLNRNAKYIDRVLDILGVTLVFHPIPDTKQTWAYPVWENTQKYSLVYSDDKFQLFRNNSVVARPALYHDYEVIHDGRRILTRFYSKDFDFRKKLILEDDPDIPRSNLAILPSGKADMVSYSPGTIQIKTNTDQPALLFLSDTFYPAWKVKVNGKEEKIYRANYAFRAVKVPAGESTVEFYYREYL